MVQLTKKTTDHISIYRDRTWEQFKLIQQGLAGLPGVRLFYYDSTIEILMPGQDHEIFKSIIGFLIEIFLFEQGIEFVPMGSATQERESIASAQPDESHCIGTNIRKSVPDLSIEVVFSSGGISKLARYKALGVPEVWFWEDGVFGLYRLREDEYARIDRSEIPGLDSLDISLLSRCILLGETSTLEAGKTFKQGIQRL
jgi:Uma2 family endonuclease